MAREMTHKVARDLIRAMGFDLIRADVDSWRIVALRSVHAARSHASREIEARNLTTLESAVAHAQSMAADLGRDVKTCGRISCTRNENTTP